MNPRKECVHFKTFHGIQIVDVRIFVENVKKRMLLVSLIPHPTQSP